MCPSRAPPSAAVRAPCATVGCHEVSPRSVVGVCGMPCRVQATTFRVAVHVPPNPNDSGLSVGGLWSVLPPRAPPRLQYKGMPLWDAGDVPQLARQLGATRATVLQVAEVLASHSIVGVIRGRQEVGPRALGHRSLLAVGDSSEMQARMNALKVRPRLLIASGAKGPAENIFHTHTHTRPNVCACLNTHTPRNTHTRTRTRAYPVLGRDIALCIPL